VGFEYRLRLARALVRLEVLDSSQVESMTAPEPDRSGTEGMSEEMSEFARACDQAFSRLDERSLEEVRTAQKTKLHIPLLTHRPRICTGLR
jgi:hypothetical protein